MGSPRNTKHVASKCANTHVISAHFFFFLFQNKELKTKVALWSETPRPKVSKAVSTR